MAKKYAADNVKINYPGSTNLIHQLSGIWNQSRNCWQLLALSSHRYVNFCFGYKSVVIMPNYSLPVEELGDYYFLFFSHFLYDVLRNQMK